MIQKSIDGGIYLLVTKYISILIQSKFSPKRKQAPTRRIITRCQCKPGAITSIVIITLPFIQSVFTVFDYSPIPGSPY